jgi:Uma2 family endonuclease
MVVSEMLFKLDPSSRQKRRPDVAFISYARWPRNRPVPGEEFWEFVPDLAIEVISPTNSAVDVVKKLEEYFRAGMRLVWVVYPTEKLVYCYRSKTDIRVFGPTDELEGDPVLPGVRLPVRALFGVEDEPEADDA